MAPRSWSKRRVASLILLVGGIVVGLKLFSASGKQVQVTLDLHVAPEVTRVEGQLVPAKGGEVVARHAGPPDATGHVLWVTKIPPGDYKAEVYLTTPQGETRVSRTVLAADEARVTIELAQPLPTR